MPAVTRCFLVGSAVFLMTTVSFCDEARVSDMLNRDEVVGRLGGDASLQREIVTAGATLVEFKGIWESRKRGQDQFMVAFLCDRGSRLIPGGLLVHSMDERGVMGTLATHSPSSFSDEKIFCPWDHVIDWRYRDTMRMKGGVVYKILYSRLNATEKRTVSDQIPFLLEFDATVSPQLATLLQDVANGRNQELDRRIGVYQDQRFRLPIPQPQLNSNRVHSVPLSIGEFVCMYGDAESLKVAQAQGLLRNEVPDEYSLVTLSCVAGNVATATALLEMGCNVNGIDDDGGIPPLTIASNRGFVELVKFLISSNADPNKPAYDGRTPLFFASSPAIAALLLEAGAQMDATDDDGRTPIDSAIYNDRLAVADFLRRRGAVRATEASEVEEIVTAAELLEQVSAVDKISDDEMEMLNDAFMIDYGLVFPVRKL